METHIDDVILGPNTQADHVLPHHRHLVLFPLLLTSSTQVSTLELELGSLDNCSLQR